MRYKKFKKINNTNNINTINNIISDLDTQFVEDKKADKLQNLNEKILTKEINKVLKKNSLKPINTHALLK